MNGKTLPAILFLCSGIFVFSLQDAIIKSVSGNYPVSQIIFIRCLSALPVILILVAVTRGLAGIVSSRIIWLLLRGVCLLFSYTFYYLAFPAMKLADVLALYSTLPLFITLLAGVILQEKVSWQRWMAVGIGFLGALIMLRPDLGMLEPASFLPIAAALAYAMGQLMARRLRTSEMAPVMAFYQNLVYFAAAGLFALVAGRFSPSSHPSLEFLLRPWRRPPLDELALMAACGPIAAIGMTLLSQAYRTAPANFVAPFEYTALIWATLWGFALFGEVPGLASLIGAALIVGSGLALVAVDRHASPEPALARRPR